MNAAQMMLGCSQSKVSDSVLLAGQEHVIYTNEMILLPVSRSYINSVKELTSKVTKLGLHMSV